jgi:hypothetical protein
MSTSYRSPDCTRDSTQCRVTRISRIQQPQIAWTPVFDGNGVQTNADPNTFIVAFSCSTCGMEWETQSKADDPPGIVLPMQ